MVPHEKVRGGAATYVRVLLLAERACASAGECRWDPGAVVSGAAISRNYKNHRACKEKITTNIEQCGECEEKAMQNVQGKKVAGRARASDSTCQEKNNTGRAKGG